MIEGLFRKHVPVVLVTAEILTEADKTHLKLRRLANSSQSVVGNSQPRDMNAGQLLFPFGSQSVGVSICRQMIQTHVAAFAIRGAATAGTAICGNVRQVGSVWTRHCDGEMRIGS